MAVSSKRIAEIATAEGIDPKELEAAIRAEESKDAPGDGPSEESAAESATKAHGGKGYYAYEYPFLTVNEIRASLFLDAIDDGGDFSGEWLVKHGGSSGSSGTPPPAAAV